MNRLAMALLGSVVLFGCATKPIDTATARSTPLSRIYAQESLVPGADKVELIVARDAGFMGGGS